MIKVKEWLDKNLYCSDKDFPETELKPNGHYSVHGQWCYPENLYTDEIDEEWTKQMKLINHESTKIHYKIKPNVIWVTCNNETLQIPYILIDGKSVGLYGYLQTYEHIPRGEPDKNGYYRRSTDEEIIKYLKSYFRIITVKNKY